MKHTPDGKVQVLTSSAFKRLKDEARTQGRKQALLEMAQSQGFSTVEEMQSFLADARKPKPKPAAQEQKPNGNGDGKAHERATREADAQRKREQAAQQAARQAQLEAKTERRRREALEAERELERTAWKVGVRDTDYAIRLLTRHLQGKSEDDLKAFDEEKFFSGLRETHPYLFGEVQKPATTGTGGTLPPPPKPGDAARGAAAGAKVDASKMTKEEFRAHLAKRGLSLNG